MMLFQFGVDRLYVRSLLLQDEGCIRPPCVRKVTIPEAAGGAPVMVAGHGAAPFAGRAASGDCQRPPGGLSLGRGAPGETGPSLPARHGLPRTSMRLRSSSRMGWCMRNPLRGSKWCGICDGPGRGLGRRTAYVCNGCGTGSTALVVEVATSAGSGGARLHAEATPLLLRVDRLARRGAAEGGLSWRGQGRLGNRALPRWRWSRTRRDGAAWRRSWRWPPPDRPFG